MKETNTHIEEYFATVQENSSGVVAKELFTAKADIDLKTDISQEEIGFINTMMLNDRILLECGLSPCFSSFYNSYMRLKVSLDRKSREEFVRTNRRDSSEDIVKGMQTAGGVIRQ